MKTKPWAIAIVLLSTILMGFAQILWKTASSELKLNLISLIFNWQLMLGLFLYAISAALLVFALKHGELSVLYPVIGMNYVWVSLFSMWLLGEIMNTLKWIGVGAIIIGVSLIGYGSRGEK